MNNLSLNNEREPSEVTIALNVRLSEIIYSFYSAVSYI